MAENVTLKRIQNYWNDPYITGFSNEAFCRAVLPDSLSSEFSRMAGTSVLRKFMNGNYHDKGKGYADATVTQMLLKEISEDRKRGRDNMLGKIKKLMEQTMTPITAEHAIFTSLSVTTFIGLSSSELMYMQKLEQTIDTLREDGSNDSICYAIFLLVLTAVLRNKMVSLAQLYSEEAMLKRKSTASMRAPSNTDQSVRDPYFSDKDYMNNYYVYIFRQASDKLFSEGELTMRVGEDGVPKATLMMRDTKGADRDPITRKFCGTPYRSRYDKTVYIVMNDQFGALGILCFHHEEFAVSDLPMYYRTGLFISSYIRHATPTVRKIAILARKVDPTELPYVRGVLKTSGQKIIISEQQLDEFRNTFRDYPWMPEFERTFVPMIKSHARTCYCLDEGEILSHSLSRLDELDRIRIMLALKSLHEPGQKEKHNKIDCVDPSNLHRIMR